MLSSAGPIISTMIINAMGVVYVKKYVYRKRLKLTKKDLSGREMYYVICVLHV